MLHPYPEGRADAPHGSGEHHVRHAMKNMKPSFLFLVVAALVAPCRGFAVRPGTNTWDRSEFGIKFTLVGPYVFVGDRADAKGKTGSVGFIREGKAKSGRASFAPLTKADSPLDEVRVEKHKQLSALKNIKTESQKSIKAGHTPAILIVFSYDPFGPKRTRRGSGYLVLADVNGLRYTVWALSMTGGDPTQDKEFSGILSTLDIAKTK